MAARLIVRVVPVRPYRGAKALPVRITVSPERLEAAAGDTLAVDVTVRNTSAVVEHYELETLGLPDGSVASSTPQVTKLRPGETGTVAVRLALSGRPPAPAGLYILGVLARSQYHGEVSRCAELPLTIAPVDDIAVRVDPQIATGRRSAGYTVEVTNDGNTPVRLALSSTDPECRTDASFDPPAVELLPGETALAALTVRAPRPWNKEKQRQLTISAAGSGAAGSATATLVQRPRLASRLARFAGALAVVLTLAAAVVVAALILLSGLPDPDGPAACRLANAVAVRCTGTQRYVVAALPGDPAACNSVPVQIRFIGPPRSVQVSVQGPGVRRMEVVYRDLSRTTESGLSATDDGRHSGIDYVLIRGQPAAVNTVTYTPADA